jgi:hypothetical protein
MIDEKITSKLKIVKAILEATGCNNASNIAPDISRTIKK